MGVSVQAPPPRDYGAETRDTLQAQIDLAPQKYAAEAQFAPQYQQLQLDMLKKATPQLLSLYQEAAPGLAQAESAARQVSRAGDIADILKLGPQAKEAIRAASPEQAAIADRMTAAANSALAAGGRLTPEQQRQTEQQVRQAQAARGVIGSPSSTLQEAVAGQLRGMGLQQQRQQQAMGALGAAQGVYGDVFQQVLGRPSQAFGAAGGALGQAQGFNPGQLFNPESQYAGDIYNQGFQAQMAARTASASNKAGLISGGLSAL